MLVKFFLYGFARDLHCSPTHVSRSGEAPALYIWIIAAATQMCCDCGSRIGVQQHQDRP